MKVSPLEVHDASFSSSTSLFFSSSHTCLCISYAICPFLSSPFGTLYSFASINSLMYLVHFVSASIKIHLHRKAYTCTRCPLMGALLLLSKSNDSSRQQYKLHNGPDHVVAELPVAKHTYTHMYTTTTLVNQSRWRWRRNKVKVHDQWS